MKQVLVLDNPCNIGLWKDCEAVSAYSCYKQLNMVSRILRKTKYGIPLTLNQEWVSQLGKF